MDGLDGLLAGPGWWVSLLLSFWLASGLISKWRFHFSLPPGHLPSPLQRPIPNPVVVFGRPTGLGRALVPVSISLSAVLAWSFWLKILFHPQRGAASYRLDDLIVVLDGGASRLARADLFRKQAAPQKPHQLLIRCPRSSPPAQPMPELLQGYDTVTQVTALAEWLKRRQVPAPRRIWIATDPDHTSRATLLARIALAGRGIQIHPDPPPPPSPSERRKLLRDALRLSLWRATGSTGAWLVPQIVARKRADCGL